MSSVQVQIFRIKGNYAKNYQKFKFTKFVRAMKEQDAIDKVLSEISSQRIFRRKINISEVVVVKPEECTDTLVNSLSKAD
jgi:ribosomal protein L20A (L18A)